MAKKTNGKTNGSPFGPNVTLPKHIVLIPDGNRRWAKEHRLPIEEGHRKGVDVVVELARATQNWGIKYFTLWAFSTENWNRSPSEIRYLMRIFREMIKKFLKEFLEKGVKIMHLGRKDRIPKFLIETLKDACEKTAKNDRYFLNIALDYGGRDEILRAVNKILSNGNNGGKITEAEFAKHLDTNGQPPPDLIIRTSGEQRLSGILLWQVAYAELYFEKVHLPDFTVRHLKKAILDFSSRQRRFGA